jgi:poly(A) polymerase
MSARPTGKPNPVDIYHPDNNPTRDTMIKAARRIVKKLRQDGHEALFAGGCVRDYFLNRKPKDIDIATSARPKEVLRLFPHSTAIGIQFGVVQVRMYGRPYEVATFRSDAVYHDGRHPSSVTFSGPRQDARRRDFTINGLFYDPEADRLIDYVGGRTDLKRKKIRAIGNPRERFAEDKLRMLRAIRFACDLSFTITAETWEAIRKLAPGILQVSGERIRDELIGIVTGPAPGSGLEMLHESGLLEHILPEVEAMHRIAPFPGSRTDMLEQTGNALSLLHHPSPELALGTLLHNAGFCAGLSGERSIPSEENAGLGGKTAEKICRRLRMSREGTERVADLVRTQPLIFKAKKMKESTLKRLLRKPDFADHMELHRVRARSSGIALECYNLCRRKLREYARQLNAPPLITGEDLISLGYKPGPLFKKMLRTIEDLQLEDAFRTKEDAIGYVKRLFPLNKLKIVN